MGRIHLFEFEDQKWFPSFMRNYMTDFLQFLSNKTGLYDPIIPILVKGLQRSKTNVIIDLGSGGGGGLLSINETLLEQMPEIMITMTDFYPNLSAFTKVHKAAPNIDYIKTPVDARNVPKDLKGLRTQFLSLHHFTPKDAHAILQNAVESENAVAVFEAQERSVPSFLAMVFSPLTVLFTTPFIRPFSWGRILFTYLIPLVPVFVLWDGMVSCLRTYSIKEMKTMVKKLHQTETYDWEINKVKSGPGMILYLLGTQKEIS
ncbi:MAG: hypothetical protein AAF554_17405 [Bacteroidota bacterium]